MNGTILAEQLSCGFYSISYPLRLIDRDGILPVCILHLAQVDDAVAPVNKQIDLGSASVFVWTDAKRIRFRLDSGDSQSGLYLRDMRKAGVTILANAEVSSVTRTADGWDTGFAVGRQIVDATGNATVAALAGARREKSPDDLRQPGSFFFWISSKGAKFDAAAVDRAFRKAVADGELLPTDVHVGMSYFIRKGGGSGCYIPLADNSTPEARADTNRRGIEARDRVLAFIRRQPGLENVSLVSSAREVGVRETYRVVGEKTISERAYLDGVVEEDALCWSYWMVDAHSAKRSHARLVFHKDGKIGSVPLGAMLPKGVGGMLVAGRAVSSDHGANSALRVQASCMAMGQAAGVVAALAASRRCDPREVPLADIKASLPKIGHIVPVPDS